jgi:hypothetical protein
MKQSLLFFGRWNFQLLTVAGMTAKVGGQFDRREVGQPQDSLLIASAPLPGRSGAPQILAGQPRSLSLGQLAPARLRDFNQGLDADQPSLMVLEPRGRFLPSRHEGVHALSQEYDVLAVLDDFGDEAHAVMPESVKLKDLA